MFGSKIPPSTSNLHQRFSRTGQTIVNVPDSTVMKLYVDDEPLLVLIDRIGKERRETGGEA